MSSTVKGVSLGKVGGWLMVQRTVTMAASGLASVAWQGREWTWYYCDRLWAKSLSVYAD